MTGLIESPQLLALRRKFYEIAGGSYDSCRVDVSKITSERRLELFHMPEFRDYVASERDRGQLCVHLKDIDKTLAEGDAFTFALEYRWRNGFFTPKQAAIVDRYLLSKEPRNRQLLVEAARRFYGLIGRAGMDLSLPRYARMRTPIDALRLWLSKVDGGEGLGLLDVWDEVYWKSQLGMTLEEKIRQANAFAPEYADRVFRDAPAENKAEQDAGVEVVCLSNGDEEVAQAISPYLGVNPENVAGSHLIIDDQGCACDVNHLYQTYEITSAEWMKRPQPGKGYKFHWWLNKNLKRFGMVDTDMSKVTVIGCDGDSASSDGGMFAYFHSVALGYFMVYDTDQRLEDFYHIGRKYGGVKGQHCTLYQRPGRKSFRPPV